MNRVWRTMVVFLMLFFTVTVAYAASYQQGDLGQDVAQIQSQLNALGYDVGKADGEYGAMTAKAVRAFQRDHGMETDGVVGVSTYRAIMGRDIPVSRDDSSTTSVRRVVQNALRFVGVPYSFGGTSAQGFDCSGFVRYVFARSGVSLPRMADEQYYAGRPVSNLQPGDTVYFSTYTSGISHVGIYLGDGKFISATSSRGVAIDRLYDGYWGPRYLGARRMI